MSGVDWIESAKFSKHGGIGRRTRRRRIRSFGLSAGLDFPDFIVFGILNMIQMYIIIFQRLKAALHYTVGRICEKAGKFHCRQLMVDYAMWTCI